MPLQVEREIEAGAADLAEERGKRSSAAWPVEQDAFVDRGVIGEERRRDRLDGPREVRARKRAAHA